MAIRIPPQRYKYIDNWMTQEVKVTLVKPSPQKETKKSESTDLLSNIELQTHTFEVITVNRHGEIINRETKQARFFTENLPNDILLEMVYIPAGTFMMGSPEGEGDDYEKPQHEVTVPPFFMGKYQITQSQWKVVSNLPQIDRELEPEPSYFKQDNQKNNLPVESVSWLDAEEFCNRLSGYTGKQYRLPSEAEWEYACRAGTTTPFHFGQTITSDLANYDASRTFADEPKGENRQKTTPVGEFMPNAYGLYDMHGNVWEWCNARLLRGGSWFGYPEYSCSAFLIKDNPDAHDRTFGIRVVCGV